MVTIGNKWDDVLAGEFEKEYYQRLRQFLIREYRTCTVYPGMYDIFNALKATSYEDVKAVILGQDPYHEPGQAHGMSFSVRKGSSRAPNSIFCSDNRTFREFPLPFLPEFPLLKRFPGPAASCLLPIIII